MARPQTKAELLLRAEAGYATLSELLSALGPVALEAEFRFDDRDRNARDVLVHLTNWHQLFLDWVAANQDGPVPVSFLPPPYNWSNYHQLNLELWRAGQSITIHQAKSQLADSHSATMGVIDSFSEDQLFTKKHYPWTGSTSLGSYCISATASHYDWANKKLKKHLRTS